MGVPPCAPLSDIDGRNETGMRRMVLARTTEN